MAFAQDGYVKAAEPNFIHLDNGLLGHIEWTDGTVCGFRCEQENGWLVSPWECRLPPGHECAHLRAGRGLIAEMPFHVTRIFTAAELEGS